MSARSHRREAEALPHFDPTASAELAVAILKKAGVPFALAGRVAVWRYVPPERQALTKDVDFAVAHRHMRAVARAAVKAGRRINPLSIGGWSIRGPDIAVDFVDRHPELAGLFEAAVTAARRRGRRYRIGDTPVPVVPKDFLIAMKIATHEPKDEQDAEALILTVPDNGYSRLRSLVRKYLGPASALRLDALARRAGHPGPGRKAY